MKITKIKLFGGILGSIIGILFIVWFQYSFKTVPLMLFHFYVVLTAIFNIWILIKKDSMTRAEVFLFAMTAIVYSNEEESLAISSIFLCMFNMSTVIYAQKKEKLNES